MCRIRRDSERGTFDICVPLVAQTRAEMTTRLPSDMIRSKRRRVVRGTKNEDILILFDVEEALLYQEDHSIHK